MIRRARYADRSMRLSLFLATTMAAISISGCLGYRQSQQPAPPANAGPTTGPAPQPGPSYGPAAPGPGPAQPAKPTDPMSAAVGAAWTLWGMMLPQSPAPAPAPAPSSPPASTPQATWPFPFPIPTLPGLPPVPGLPGASPAPAPAPADNWPAQSVAFEDEVLSLTNARRAQGASCGGQQFPPAGPLAPNALLRRAARGHALDMATRDYFDHMSPEGRGPAERAKAAGYASPFVGENIAAGQRTPSEVVDDWMKSTGHCSNIMDARYRVLGVGSATRSGSRMGIYWVQNFGN